MEYNQTPTVIQPPGDELLKLTHADLEYLSGACLDAIAALKLNREQWDRPSEDESVEQVRISIDADITAYTELKARLTEELKHCERCRRIAPLHIYDPALFRSSMFHCYCEACIKELEAAKQ
jgi:hypothetical protein